MDKETFRDIYLESWVVHTSQYKYSEGIQVLNDMSNNYHAL